jgi:hypothetical protein
MLQMIDQHKADYCDGPVVIYVPIAFSYLTNVLAHKILFFDGLYIGTQTRRIQDGSPTVG